MNAAPANVHLAPRVGPLYPAVSRYRRTTLAIFLAGAAWVPVARAASLSIVVSLALPLILLALSPFSVRKWWPGMALSVWNRWLQAWAWTRATQEPFSRAGAQRWLDRHPEPSLRRLSALGWVHSYEEAGRLLDTLHPDSPVEIWQLEYARASYAMAVGREPNLPELDTAWANINADNYPLSSRRNGAVQMAFLRAQNEVRLGRNGADYLTQAAGAMDLASPPLRLQLAIWWYRYRGPVPFMCLLFLWWAV
jgi:hypothetical protein